MQTPQPFRFAALLIILAITAIIGCSSQQPPKTQDLSDAQVRQLAFKFRDAWISEGKDEAASILARSSIVEVERQAHGWHITFMTPTGHGPETSEGLHDYFLHIYLKPSGDLDRIERGPDLLS